MSGNYATLSYSTEVFAAQPLEVAIRWAHALGLGAVEVGKHHAEQLHGDATAGERGRAVALECGVRLASLHAWTGIDGLTEVCPTAHKLGVGLIVVHCRHEQLVGDLPGCVQTLSRWADWCGRHEVVLTVENSSRQPLRPFVELFAAVPALKMTLDVKHAYKPKLFGLTHVDYMNELGDRVANFHMLGIDPARDDDLGDGIPAGFEPPGLSWRQLADDLAARQYRGLITAECSLHVGPDDAERLYYDLAPADDNAPTLAHRLSRHNVRFFGKLFGTADDPAAQA